MNRQAHLLLALGIFCAGLLIAQVHAQRTAPSIRDAFCIEEGGNTWPCTLPLRVQSEHPVMTVIATLTLPQRFPHRFHVRTLGCLEEFTVNGESVLHRPFCHEPLGEAGDIGYMLSPGDTVLTLRMRNDAEGILLHELDIRPSRLDSLVLTRMLFLLTIILICGFIVIQSLWPRGTPHFWMAMVFLGGIVLRILYVSATPISVRAYDWQNHLLYSKLIYS